MVDGKYASDLQNYDNLSNKPVSIKNPCFLNIDLSGTKETKSYDGSENTSVNVTEFKVFDSENELRESNFQGCFKIGKSGDILSGISFRAEDTSDEAPENRLNYENYVRLVTKRSSDYCDENRELTVWTDIMRLGQNTWIHNSNDISMKGHLHDYLPLNGGKIEGEYTSLKLGNTGIVAEYSDKKIVRENTGAVIMRVLLMLIVLE